MRLSAVDPVARRLGLTPGLTLADARAREPGLKVVDNDPHADRLWLERLADLCLRYTPRVALDPPDGLILDITGCAHLFGGEGASAGDLAARLGRFGAMVSHAAAATPDASRARARFPHPAVADEAEVIRHLPVVALRLGEERTGALLRAGLKTIGDLTRRPMAGIAARFGADAVGALNRLIGTEDTPLRYHHAPPAISIGRRFADPIAHVEYALNVLAELMAAAAEQLEAQGHGGRCFEALFFRSDNHSRRLRVETGLATRDPQVVMRLFRERIGALDDPLDPGFGYDFVRLGVPLTEPLATVQLKLEGGSVAEAEVVALVDRLATRLGQGRLCRFAPGDSHIPERAQVMLPVAGLFEPGGWLLPEAGEPPLRPLQMFDPPMLIEVIAEMPDGPPRRFRWRRTLHDVTRYEGPERIASEWWRHRDGGGLTRDYYRVEDGGGRRFWIFRRGLYGDEEASPGWYLHGLFA